MKIVVFGASGKTGRLVVAQAAQRGDDVVAFVRDASKQWYPDAVNVHQGDPSDAKAVEVALAGADAVVSALGPIAEETTTEISDATRTIVDAMERIGSAPYRDRHEREGLLRHRGHRVRTRTWRPSTAARRRDPARERAGLDRGRGPDAHRRSGDRLVRRRRGRQGARAARSPVATSRPPSSTPSRRMRGSGTWWVSPTHRSNPRCR